MVMLHLPAPGKLQLLVGEHVEEGDEVAVMLVALKVMSVPTHLTDHVLQTGVACKHAVGTLGREGREVRSTERDRRRTREQLLGHFQFIHSRWRTMWIMTELRIIYILLSYMISAGSVVYNDKTKRCKYIFEILEIVCN